MYVFVYRFLVNYFRQPLNSISFDFSFKNFGCGVLKTQGTNEITENKTRSKILYF